MSATGSPPPSPHWSQSDSIGLTAWQRLMNPGVLSAGQLQAPPMTRGAASIHERHSEFIDSLSVRVGSGTEGVDRGDDPRVFRQSARAVARWPGDDASGSGFAADEGRPLPPIPMDGMPVGIAHRVADSDQTIAARRAPIVVRGEPVLRPVHGTPSEGARQLAPGLATDGVELASSMAAATGSLAAAGPPAAMDHDAAGRMAVAHRAAAISAKPSPALHPGSSVIGPEMPLVARHKGAEATSADEPTHAAEAGTVEQSAQAAPGSLMAVEHVGSEAKASSIGAVAEQIARMSPSATPQAGTGSGALSRSPETAPEASVPTWPVNQAHAPTDVLARSASAPWKMPLAVPVPGAAKEDGVETMAFQAPESRGPIGTPWRHSFLPATPASLARRHAAAAQPGSTSLPQVDPVQAAGSDASARSQAMDGGFHAADVQARPGDTSDGMPRPAVGLESRSQLPLVVASAPG